MRKTGKVMGIAALICAAAPGARAHELACEKSVNGDTFLELDSFPTKITYSLTVRNIHPDSASEVLEASDPTLEAAGFGGFSTPFTLPFEGEETKAFVENVSNYKDCLKLAAEDGEEDEYIDNVFTVRWDVGTDVCTTRVRCVDEKEELGKRMTGGGSVFGSGSKRVTHGFELRCDPADPRQNLEINWPEHKFKLTTLTSASCTDDPALDEGNPVAGFDTYTGQATGEYDGVAGATIEFVFTDDGEPGKDDTATMLIRDKDGNVVLDVGGPLNFGNHQAHP